jgi:hypothetical protein
MVALPVQQTVLCSFGNSPAGHPSWNRIGEKHHGIAVYWEFSDAWRNFRAECACSGHPKI